MHTTNPTEVSRYLHQAMENRDINLLLDLYHDDAELRIVDRHHPPSKPISLKGKESIGAHFKDIFARTMKHKVQDEVIGSDHLAYTEDCEYPDGSHVLTSSLAEVRDGRIVREVELQEWD